MLMLMPDPPPNEVGGGRDAASGSNPFSSSYKSGPSSGPPSAGSAASMAGDQKSLYDTSSFLIVLALILPLHHFFTPTYIFIMSFQYINVA